MFVDGGDFEKTYETSLGPVGVLAEVQIRDQRLILNALSIYPIETSERLPIGVRRTLEILRSIKQDALDQGFSDYVVNSKKLTGASPGRIVKVERRLK
jgi:hypothetical protein